MYKLHQPQEIVKQKIKDCLIKKYKKILVFAPTGFGKTILSYDIIKNAIDKNNSVLFTSHRIALAKQSKNKFKDLNPQYLQGKEKNITDDYKLIVASIHTLIKVEIKEPKIIIIDEVHYAYESNLIQSLFIKFPNAIIIGLSATPVDDKGYLLEGFDYIIDDYQTADLIDLGFLTPFKYYTPISINFDSVKIKGNEYDNVDLENAINKIDINQSIVDNYKLLGENRSFILFAVNKNHCDELYKVFTDNEIKVGIITATTKEKERDKLISDLKNKAISGLISIEILTAGFDEPLVSCIMLAMKTMQWKKYIQCAGRGIRLNGLSIEESISNGKSDCILLDFCGNIEEHGLPTDRKQLTFNTKISKVIDREFNINLDLKKRNVITSFLTEEKQVYLKKISSLLDLYDGKEYKIEAELQEDVNSFLKKTNYFWWRQNSGKAFIKDRWVHFASKNGLPDNTVFFNNTSFYFALELKLPKGRLTDFQKETLPEMTNKKVLFFICESVYDVFKAIEHIENNIIFTDESTIIYNTIYDLDTKQQVLRKKFNIPLYNN
jgi:superfamily II DNA or RNA helicase